MGVVQADLGTYKALTNSSSGTNGGHMSANQVTDGLAGEVFPDSGITELTSGSVRYAKVFQKQSATTFGDTLSNPRVLLSLYTPGEDAVTFFIGTQSQIQSDISADGIDDTETHYGAAGLNTAATALDTSIEVYLEDPTYTIFRAGDDFRISDQTTYGDSGTGNEEFHLIDSVNVVGNVATIAFSDSALAHDYSTADTVVSSVADVSDIVSYHDNLVATTVGDGDYDDSTYPVETNNEGCIEDTITLTFTSATAFTAAGVRAGDLGSGNTSSDFSPTNGDFSVPYFTLRAAGFSGTWASGDTLVFDIHASSVAVWLRRYIPAACSSLTGNKCRLVLDGEASA